MVWKCLFRVGRASVGTLYPLGRFPKDCNEQNEESRKFIETLKCFKE